MSEPITLDKPTLRIDYLGGGAWRLRAAQVIRVARDELFPFFADAANLGRITPREMRFEIASPTPISMREGTLIDYRIRIWGVPLRWRTLISRWAPPHEFVDTQLRGPYAEWVHTHRFTPIADGATLMEDEVHFRLPFGRLGALLAGPLVRRQVGRIFRYRRDAISATLLGATARTADVSGSRSGLRL